MGWTGCHVQLSVTVRGWKGQLYPAQVQIWVFTTKIGFHWLDRNLKKPDKNGQTGHNNCCTEYKCGPKLKLQLQVIEVMVLVPCNFVAVILVVVVRYLGNTLIQYWQTTSVTCVWTCIIGVRKLKKAQKTIGHEWYWWYQYLNFTWVFTYSSP